MSATSQACLLLLSALLLCSYAAAFDPQLQAAVKLTSQTTVSPSNFSSANWGASLLQQTHFTGDGTFYGQQSDQEDNGACAFGSNMANKLNLSWSTGIDTFIAMNDAQYSGASACGMCIVYRGNGTGIGMTPISTEWKTGMVTNRCPECAFGSIDLDANGDGRWKVEWYPTLCNVGDGVFNYWIANSNPYWLEFVVTNTRLPIKSIDLEQNGNWTTLTRGVANRYDVYSGPFNFPLRIRLTSILDDVVEDTIPSGGGRGTAQFPINPQLGSSSAPTGGTSAGRKMMAV